MTKMTSDTGQVERLTEVLQRFTDGDRAAANTLMNQAFPHLRKIAARKLVRERGSAGISPTELINETWVGYLGRGGWRVKDRDHFYALASRAMRQALIDLARRRLAVTRGEGAVHRSLDSVREERLPTVSTAEEVVEIGKAMERMAAAEPELARIVDMHYFAGFSLEEVGRITGLPVRRVRYLWDEAKRWLSVQLKR